MPDREANLDPQRHRMVREQLERRGIANERVLDAFRSVPRHEFVPPGRRAQAYEDHPVSIGSGQTISQPYIVALSVEQLDPQPGDRVLDVGAGSGYQTAILASIVSHVYAIERHESLADEARERLRRIGIENVSFRADDGTVGWAAEAPFDGIICGAAGPDIPAPWIDQLADGGRIVAPIGSAGYQVLTRLQRRGDEIRRREVCGVRFVPLIGEHGWTGEQDHGP